jgi:hypothetical protein
MCARGAVREEKGGRPVLVQREEEHSQFSLEYECETCLMLFEDHQITLVVVKTCAISNMAATSPSSSKRPQTIFDNQCCFVVQATLRPALFCGFNVKLVPESHLSVTI